MPAGGARTPSNPAPVSGPGAMSRRTDGGPGQPVMEPGGLPYGENQELRSTQGAAPMSGQSPQAAALQANGVPLADMSPNLFDPTNAPGEPVTAGMPFGAGPGPAGQPMPQGPTQERLRAALPTMLRMAESPYVSAEFKALAYYIRQTLNGQ
jgi:hypothetical protein